MIPCLSLIVKYRVLTSLFYITKKCLYFTFFVIFGLPILCISYKIYSQSFIIVFRKDGFSMSRSSQRSTIKDMTNGSPAKLDSGLCGSDADGTSVPAVLQHGRYDHCWKISRCRCTGFGRFHLRHQLYD